MTELRRRAHAAAAAPRGAPGVCEAPGVGREAPVVAVRQEAEAGVVAVAVHDALHALLVVVAHAADAAVATGAVLVGRAGAGAAAAGATPAAAATATATTAAIAATASWGQGNINMVSADYITHIKKFWGINVSISSDFFQSYLQPRWR